jgi:hypothetical protein
LSGSQAGGAPLPGDSGGARPDVRGGARGQGHTGDASASHEVNTSHDASASRLLARVVFALLVLGCFAALLVTQRLKHTPTLVQEFKLTKVIVPTSQGEAKEEHIAFKLAKADEVTVTIESSSGETVATLVHDLSVGRYKILSLRWNGHRGTAHGFGVLRKADGYTTLLAHNRGRVAPPGEYTVRVSLRREARSIPSSRTFKLVGP